MSDAGFVRTLEARLHAAGQRVDAEGKVCLSLDALADFLSRNNLEAIRQFMRLQRKAGVQTVHYTHVQPDSFTSLAERMVEVDLVLRKETEAARQLLQEQVVDIRPVVDGRLFLLCNRHRSLDDFGLGFTQKVQPQMCDPARQRRDTAPQTEGNRKMEWTRKDWHDLLLMSIGAVAGVAAFGMVIAPYAGLRFSHGDSLGYLLAVASGMSGGYALRVAAWLLRKRRARLRP